MTAGVTPMALAGSVVQDTRHICAFFNDEDEEYRVLLPFINEGFVRGDKAIHVVGADHSHDHLQRLTLSGIDAGGATARGQLEVRSTADTYLRDGRFDVDRMLAVFERLASGNGTHAFPRSRIVCRMDWAAESRPLIDAVVEFESRVNNLWRDHDDVVICAYRLDQFKGDAVIDILRTHPAVIIGGILQRNPFFIPPQQFLPGLRTRRAAEKTGGRDGADSLASSPEELARLRGCLTDLVSVMALPAVWAFTEPPQILGTLLDALFGVLRLTFVLVRLSDPDGGPAIELMRVASPFEGTIRAQDVTDALAVSLPISGRSPEWLPRWQLQVADAQIRVTSVPLGLTGERGVVIAGCQRDDFPADTEAVVIQVAVNEAAMGLQQARLVTMQRRIAADLDERVALRTGELAAANLELKAETEERRRAEEALRRSQALLADAQRISATGGFSWRLDTDEITFSEELYRIFELEAGSPVSLEQVAARVHPDDGPVLSQFIAKAREGADTLAYELRLLMRDGSIKYTRTHGNVVEHPNARRECVGAMQDVTQRHLSDQALDRARSELARVTRSITVGALTASIAHEVNQPLSGIITNAGTCVRLLSAEPPNVTGALETARRTIRDGNRAADIVARLRGLYSNRTVTAEVLDLNDAAREVMSLLSNDLQRGRVMLMGELERDALLVTGDRVQLQQVMLNLIRNAADAMSEVEDRPRHLVVRTERDQERVRLTVRDVGVGLDPAAVDRLFDAFYTTKDDGMGMGLSVSRSIIERHGGRLWAAANEGPGATFGFSIPRNPHVVGGVLQA